MNFKDSNIYKLGEFYTQLGYFLKRKETTIGEIIDLCSEYRQEFAIDVIPELHKEEIDEQ